MYVFVCMNVCLWIVVYYYLNIQQSRYERMCACMHMYSNADRSDYFPTRLPHLDHLVPTKR